MSGQAAERFTGRVEEYRRFRMGYPDWVRELLVERCGLGPGRRVLDVGAGTGMLTELLLQGGAEVTALEPNPEMRAACVAGLQARWGAQLRVLDGAAEQTGLPEQSVEMVTAGRAFHWFDRERAVAEFQRVLRPGGWLVLAAHRRRQRGSAQAEAYERLLEEFGNDYEGLRGSYGNAVGLDPWGGESFQQERPGEQELTLDEFLGQTQSLSLTPLPTEPGYAAMQEALRAYFARWSQHGVLRLETVCGVVGWRRGM